MLIRPTSILDAESLKSLRLLALRSEPLAFTADLPDTQSKPFEWWQDRAKAGAGLGSEVVMVAEQNTQLIAMAGIYTPHEPKLAHSGTIWGVFVLPGHRRQGIGRALLQNCITWAKQKNLIILYLSVAAANHTAKQCYESLGFKTYGTQPLAIHLDGRYHDETLMALRI